MRLVAQRKHCGQNLVEFLLVIPFFIILAYACLEFMRGWQTWNGAKMAALDAAYTAAVNHSTVKGSIQLQQRLAEANLNVMFANVASINDDRAYQVSVSVLFTPVFGGLSIPTVAGPISIIPASFPVTYTAVRAPSVY
jgi:Flp pilus assembly protein TadG